MQTRLLRAALGALLFSSCGIATLSAQCGTQWLPGAGIPGVDGEVHTTTMWDPDGAGPQPPRLVIGGYFATAGTVAASKIAAWDPGSGTWSAFGAGLSGGIGGGFVWALAGMPNGDLVAAGSFTQAGGVPVNYIARWDGIAWNPLGAGPNWVVERLAVLPNGDLVVAGGFSTAGGVPANGLARWDGTAWSQFGGGAVAIKAMVVMPNGDLVVGGNFGFAGGVAVSWIARWNGVTWSPLGTGLNGTVVALTVLPNGDLVAGGYFSTAGGLPASGIARWDGVSWSALGPAAWSSVSALALLPNGDLLAGGVGSGNPPFTVSRWDGATWTPYPGGSYPSLLTVRSITVLPGGDFVVGGYVTDGIQRWNGAAWASLTQVDAWSVAGGLVTAIVNLPNGEPALAGTFAAVAGGPAPGLARWNGTTLAPLGPAITDPISALALRSNGDLVVSGYTNTAFGLLAWLGRWNGAAWLPISANFGVVGAGGSVYSQVKTLLALPGGEVVVGGAFSGVEAVTASNVARWNGTTWSPLGTGTNGEVLALARLTNGDLVAGGFFTMAGGGSANRIARWNGTTWSPLGAGTGDAVLCLLVRSNGDLIVGGQFTTAGGAPANGIARWNGSAWSPLGGGTNAAVWTVFELPDGDLLVGGQFTYAGGVPANGLARWDGTTWSSMAAPFVFLPGGAVRAIAMRPNGELVVGGGFVSLSPPVPPNLARLASTCPATSVASGLGCASSGGNNTLAALTPPWVDATFRSRATGLPAVAIAATLLSFTPVAQGAVPLASVFAQSPPGCDLLVAPDILGVVAVANGVADYAAVLPNTPPLVGLTFFHQMVPIELDPQGNVVAITATNALQLTAGTF